MISSKTKSYLRKWLIYFTAVALLFTGFSTNEALGETNEEAFYRAFWVQAFEPGLKTPDEIDQLVLDVKEANMNAIIAQVSRRHDAYYHSDVLPFTEDPAVEEGFDPLGYLIEQASDHDIEVHAWVIVGPMWHTVYGGAPEDPDHIWNQHGPDAPEDETWVTKGYDGEVTNYWQPYLDLGHPDARDHVVEMVVDVAQNYDIDGVHLDYIRYPENPAGQPPGWNGYNPTALERFQQETGRTDRPEPDDAQWLEWKVDQVDSLVKRTYVALMDVDMDADLTAAVLSWGFDDPRETDFWDMDPVQRSHQNWEKWVQEGYLDYAYVMNYDSEADPARAERYDAWIEWQKDLERNRGILIGPALYMNSIEDSIAQIQRAIEPSPAGNRVEGVSPYVYNVWSNDQANEPLEDLIQSLSQPTEYNDGNPPFAEQVHIPEAEWKNPPYGHMLAQISEDGAALSQQHITLTRGNSDVSIEGYTDANGYIALTDLQPGQYFIEINGQDNGEKILVQPGEVSTANLEK